MQKKYNGKINISVIVFSNIGRNHIVFFSEIKQNVLDRDNNALVGHATGNNFFPRPHLECPHGVTLARYLPQRP